MENSTNKTGSRLWLDTAFVGRVFKKWIIAVLCVSIIVSVVAYIAADTLLDDAYQATAIVSVVSKNNTPTALRDSDVLSAVGRNIAMWNSNVLLKAVQDANPAVPVRGKLSAVSIGHSGLIRLAASADTAENAYYLLNSAIRCYHQVDPSFDQAYIGVLLTRVTSSSITANSNQPFRIALMAFLASLAVCLGLLLIWSVLTDTIHNQKQAEQLLEVPVYESIVSVNKHRLASEAVLITNGKIDMDYLSGLDKLASRLDQLMHRRDQKVLMVTSIKENEGKSTVAANLALSLARRGFRTLLMDMDFRRPGLYRIFDHEKIKDQSLSVILQKGGDLLKAVEHRPDLYHLNLLWQFRSEEDSDRVLETLELKEIFDSLAENYDYVIVDTPPLGPIRDTEVLAQSCASTLLVVRQDFCHAAAVNDVVDLLQENGSQCIGAVLNNCKARRRFHKTGQTYGYGAKSYYKWGGS